MASNYDATEFVDRDFQAHQASSSRVGAGSVQRAPTREEVDSRVADAQQKLGELRRAQEQLERERAMLEETRRRQTEFQTGRQEMIHHLTRGLGLLEEAEFNCRRDAEQMAKALIDLRDALNKVQAACEETWTQENFQTELTRALTVLENARMEWNSARLKFPVLSGQLQAEPNSQTEAAPGVPAMTSLGFGQLCRLGLAMTWPLMTVGLAVFAALIAVLLRR